MIRLSPQSLQNSKYKDFFGLTRSYAAILFAQKPWVGLLFVIATFAYPNTGAAGLLGAVTGLVTARLLSFPNQESGLYGYNSLLVGLSLGAVYQMDFYLMVLVVLGGILAVFVTAFVSDLLWRWEHLPTLSLPFVLVALLIGFAAKGYGALSIYLSPLASIETVIHPWVDNFFIAFGAAFFVPNPFAGMILFFGIFITSRYLAFLSICGFVVGQLISVFLLERSASPFEAWVGFNYILTAMAIGGIFMVPGWGSFGLAMIGAALAALVTSAVQNVMTHYGLPVFAIPFLLATFTILAASRKRPFHKPPFLLLEQPDLPEKSFERVRLHRVRTGNIQSVPLRAPFYGEWVVSQGVNGPHTHKAPWQYALDFLVEEKESDHAGSGENLTDYFCFGLPVVAPAYGQVVRLRNDIEDNVPGEVNIDNNWGNFIMIRLLSGLHVLLAHLQKGSIEIEENDWVRPGQTLAAVGSSGRSPRPHLHLHVQTYAALGSATCPFHLVSVLRRTAGQNLGRFELVAAVAQKDRITPVTQDQDLAKALHFPVGRYLYFRGRRDLTEWQLLELAVELSLLGQFRLVSKTTGASVAFEENEGVLALFDRQGADDELFDIWVLAMGVTPLSAQAEIWEDEPAGSLMPLPLSLKTLFKLMLPFQPAIKSCYQRYKVEDKEIWKQHSVHSLRYRPVIDAVLNIETILKKAEGCIRILAKNRSVVWEIELRSTAQIDDEGRHAWNRVVESENSYYGE